MKKINKETGKPQQGSPIGISVTIDEAPLLKSLVEKLAHRRLDTDYAPEPMPAGWQAVETSTIEAYVSGCMDIIANDEHITLPYTTCFSFTCTKLAGEDNTLTWVNSLS